MSSSSPQCYDWNGESRLDPSGAADSFCAGISLFQNVYNAGFAFCLTPVVLSKCSMPLLVVTCSKPFMRLCFTLHKLL